MFEYMSAGLPVIASNFPLWKSIIEKDQSGICVNPKDINKITEAIQFLINNPEEAKQMGIRGRASVISTYNWSIEEKKLIELYRTLI